MDQRPIGVIRLRPGGLTAVHALWKILPEEDLIYFGDTARVPYGTAPGRPSSNTPDRMCASCGPLT